MKRHVILVGLPGSGKTTVGRRAVELLSTDFADFTDIDEAVESETGRSIARIFADSGEAEFRRLERAAMDRALEQPPHLIAAGAGWIAQPGNLDAALAAGAAVVHLKVSPATAAARIGDDQARPLLERGLREGMAERIGQLLAEREQWYRQSTFEVDAERDVESVAREVARAMSDER
ncbi:MAG TPA: shikimate kinase [Gemmatimonadales bacterium]|nr:shikimate kinase [Gemmatimonadales bacterium]